jgi:endonuclease/exonuclease/phosphatase family metal-dependent hydrolase
MLLKILTYNILDGGAGRQALILQVLQLARPDVVILQEVYQAQFVEHLGQALAMQPFFGVGNRQRHVALLSRLPVVSIQSHHPYPPIWRNFVEAELEYRPGQRLKLFGIHPMAGLELPLEAWRGWEASTVLRYSRPYQNTPCLIGGDFNAIAPLDAVDIRRMPPWMRAMILLQGNRIYRISLRAYLRAGFIDSFRRLNPQAGGFTYPTQRPNTRLDYLLVNAALAPAMRRCQVLQEPEAAHTASDHYPVMLELEL